MYKPETVPARGSVKLLRESPDAYCNGRSALREQSILPPLCPTFPTRQYISQHLMSSFGATSSRADTKAYLRSACLMF